MKHTIRAVHLGMIAAGLAAMAAASVAQAQTSRSFRFVDSRPTSVSGSQNYEGLTVVAHIRRSGVEVASNRRNEVCADFRNTTANAWAGGYRIDATNNPRTHATLRVPANQTVTRCELLPLRSEYYVLLHNQTEYWNRMGG